jgi:two-component system, LytTR family, sensor histidine kinase AlgZ
MPEPPSTRFDPQAEERARLRSAAAAAFDVCHPGLALRALVLVQVLLAVVALGGAENGAQWLAREATLGFGGLFATLLWLAVVCALQGRLARLQPTARALAVVAVGGAAALGAWAPLAWAGFVQGGSPQQVAAVALAGMGIAAGLWAWLDLRSQLWQPAHSAARLAELQSRIRPHFLFNALNTALALVRTDPAKAEAVLEDLAELFRVALADAGTSVSLAEEVDLAKRYLAIEQLRFGERLQVMWDIEPQTDATRVPPLMLQPLVENAVRHGIERLPEGGYVRIEAHRARGQVTLTVTNSVGEEGGADSIPSTANASTESPAAQPGHGMALHNLRERLRLLHDIAAECHVARELENGQAVFRARVVLPAA